MAEEPTIEDVRGAAERIAGHAVRTPLTSSPMLDDETGTCVLLKCETLQRTGSFKFRGAYNAIAAMPREEREKGVVAVSSGNHAQGVAEAARLFGIRATIVMPADAPAVKRERTERSGGRIVAYDRASEDRDAVAARFIAEHGGALIHPYNDPEVIAGQGTAGLEIAEDCVAAGLRPDVVVIPCGGGGLSAGVGLAVRDRFPAAAIVLVEPEGFDDYGRSLREGRIVANAAASGSVCDALLAPSPGPIGFAVNQRNHASAVAVGDDEALAAVAFAFRELKLVVEPGGAVALAALRSGKIEAKGRTVIIVLSGGNIDDAVLQRALGSPA
ncbi:MAG: threonine/serine dehydratase [Bauldia sp.]|nr:threonine/serine dehydratase [Bauldia sp.]